MNPESVIGRAPESLTLVESLALAGKFVAIEMYSPEKTPLKRIEAIGANAGECIRQLASRGLDPSLFEFSRLLWPHT